MESGHPVRGIVDPSENPSRTAVREVQEETPVELPAWVSESEGLPTNDLTHVADVDHLKVFACRNDEDDRCVLLAIEPTSEDSGWVTGANCAPAEQFASDGVQVKAAALSARRGSAMLLPDNFSGEIADGWERVNDNLAVRP